MYVTSQTLFEAAILKSIDEVFIQHPKFFCSLTKLRKKAIKMQQAFCGEIAYAVKANPHPKILLELSRVGITHFDVASLQEAKLVRSLIPNSKILFNNPIKTPYEIQRASSDLAINHFTVQSISEASKVLGYSDFFSRNKLEIAVRLKAPTSSKALINHSVKFGIALEEIEELLIYLIKHGIKHIILSVHIGSANHSSSIAPYYDTLTTMYELAKKFSAIKAFNLGGGFPANFYQTTNYHDVIHMLNKISTLIKKSSFQPDLYQYYIEPGLSMVGEATALVTPIAHVDHQHSALYIRDGIYTSYGCFNVHNHNYLHAYLYRRKNKELIKIDQNPTLFTVYGQTCDGADKIFMHLPATVASNDMICLETAGAYMSSVASSFNGFPPIVYVFY